MSNGMMHFTSYPACTEVFDSGMAIQNEIMEANVRNLYPHIGPQVCRRAHSVIFYAMQNNCSEQSDHHTVH
jgi:hypothetical protein